MEFECGKCGSNRIIPDAQVTDQGQGSSGTLEVAVTAHPSAIVFKGRVYDELHAAICADCGYVELYVVNPADLYEAYQTALQEGPPESL